MTGSTIAVVIATLMGPVLAVQAQKWVERAREASSRRHWIFLTMMATRQATVSVEHVNALNSIDLAFYGQRFFGKAWRSKAAQDVLDAWAEYRTHLTPSTDLRDVDPAEVGRWSATGRELFINLLEKLAIANRYKFEREQLKSGGYTPQSYVDVESQQKEIRRLALELLNGERALRIDADPRS